MTEKELEKLKDAKIKKRYWSGECQPDTIFMQLFADIACQLTRIADQGQQREDMTFCKGFGKGLETGRKQRDPTPAPHTGPTDLQDRMTDALVEAVKELMSSSECYCPENVAWEGLCGFCRVKAALAKYEAAHEKAGSDGN